jgi:LEA14-like dessication related protein
MDGLNVLFLIAAVGVGVIALNFTKVGDTVQVILKSVTVNSINNWSIVITVQNVTNTSVTVNSLVGTVSVNGAQIGNVSSFIPVNISGNSQSDITVVFQPSLLTLPNAVITAIQAATSNNQLQFNVSGNFNLNSLVLPFSLSQNVSI